MPVTCLHCSFANPTGFRYCGNCGRPLEGELPKVSPFVSSPLYHPSQVLSPEEYQQFEAAARQVSGERRNVVVLFADICDYTVLSQQIGAEEVFSLINRYLAVLIEQVYKYGGVIDKFTGDGVMALFGAPIAHENDAERAVRATIDMQATLCDLNREINQELGVDIRVRMGLHFGSVVFGRVGVHLDDALSVMDYTAIGDIVNYASRLEQAAQPGTTLVSQSIRDLTHMLFDFEEVAGLELKGYSQPVSAFRVLALKALPGRVRGLEGRQTPLIGRAGELAQVSAVVDAASKTGAGHVLLVTGEAGLGKSRLTAELKRSSAASEVTILEGGSLAYRRSVSYWTFREMLYRYLGFQDEDSQAERQQKIRRRLAELGEELVSAAPLLEIVLSVPPADIEAADRLQQLDAEQLRQRTFVAIHDLLLAEAQRRPLVLILEDLHWADRLSLDLILFLMDIVPQAPLVLYCISRPVEGGAADLLAEHANTYYNDHYTAVPLQPLSSDQSQELLSALLAIPKLPAGLQSTIYQRAEGNPFYLEEIIRMLISDGAIQQSGEHWEVAPGANFDNLDVPETLQGLVMARFDRLPDDLREVLQVAAVVGFRFSARVLRKVLPWHDLAEKVQALEAQEFIVRLADTGGAVYHFRHVITSDTIYGSILRQQRSEIHGRVAQAIESFFFNRLEEQVEALATHYARSSFQDRALYYLARAGNKAARAFANAEALAYYEQALDLLGRVGSTIQQQLDVLVGMGDVLVFVGEYELARKRYQQAIIALQRRAGLADAHRMGSLERRIASTCTKQGDYDQALIYLAAALRQVQAGSGPAAREEMARICEDTGWVYLRRGLLDQARSWLQRGLELVDETRNRDIAASIYNRLAGAFFQESAWTEAAYWLDKSLQLQQQLGDLAGMARSHNNLGVMAARQGDFEAARRNLARSLELRSQIGDIEGVLSIKLNLGAVLITLGDLDGAKQALAQALDTADRIGHNFYKAMTYLNLGRLRIAARDWQAAVEVLDVCVEILGEIGAQDDLVDAYYFLGEATMGLNELDRAESWAGQALELSTHLGTHALGKSFQKGRCQRLLGAVKRERLLLDESEQLLRASWEVFKALGNRLEQAKTAYELALLAHVRGEDAVAAVYADEAAKTCAEMGARLELDKIQGLVESLQPI